ncbi:c-type cytochrome [Mucilaginibacter sp. S1162]|uniref:Photosynthetic reaction center cytochrome c subunit n=1 Tax=Mucilaginibacter humi TaxID=2732510 RepID=A0ABX1VYD4_9SPHI|nr:c-type cytochrome [Mucilaginibacter humi]NNU32994.1 c-type cytochrome [Mucilaginibacter humi]
MRLNKNLTVTICLISAVIVLASMTLIQQQPPQQRVDPKVTNLKVLPKKLTFRQVDHIMDQWADALGVRCGFCHARNEETKKMDYASDAKPEKEMARDMYRMTAKLNSKYFKGEKDSLGVAKMSSVNCYTCHRGVAHLEAATWPPHGRPAGPPPGGQPKPQGTPPAQGGGR